MGILFPFLYIRDIINKLTIILKIRPKPTKVIAITTGCNQGIEPFNIMSVNLIIEPIAATSTDEAKTYLIDIALT